MTDVQLNERDLRGSPGRFGYEWSRYAEMLPEYEEQFRGWTVHISPAEWRGKILLSTRARRSCARAPMIYLSKTALTLFSR